MQIKKDELIKILDLAKIAVSGSGHVEQLSHFIFTGDEIVTFNNRMSVVYPFKSNFVCSVRWDLFYKQLTKFTSNDIDISLKGNRLTMKGAAEKATLSVVLDKDDEIFRNIHSIQNDHVDLMRFVVPKNFTKAASFASFSASKDESDGILCCVCVLDDCVYSTDNWRASQYKLDSKISGSFLLSRMVAAHLDKFDILEVSVGSNWLSFYCDNDVIISARQIYGGYPDFSDSFILDEYESLSLPAQLEEAIDFVSVILSKEHPLEKVADINIKGNEITVSCDKTTESSEKTVPIEDSETDIDLKFSINIEFLKVILKHTHTMEYNTELQKALFSSNDFKHIIRMK